MYMYMYMCVALVFMCIFICTLYVHTVGQRIKSVQMNLNTYMYTWMYYRLCVHDMYILYIHVHAVRTLYMYHRLCQCDLAHINAFVCFTSLQIM